MAGLLQDQHVRADHQGEAAENCVGGINTKPKQLRPDCTTGRMQTRTGLMTRVRSVDLQKVIMLPRMPGVKSAVFTRQISTYHETFASVGKKQNKRKTISVVWHQGIAGRNAKEIKSAYAE